MALTTTGMTICPRRNGQAVLRNKTGAEVGTLELNGTLLAGTLMVKAEKEWNLLLDREGSSMLDALLAQVGIPWAHHDGNLNEEAKL